MFSITPVRGPQQLLKTITRSATPVRGPQRPLKASTRLAPPVQALQRLSKASTCLEPPVQGLQRLSKASTTVAQKRAHGQGTLLRAQWADICNITVFYHKKAPMFTLSQPTTGYTRPVQAYRTHSKLRPLRLQARPY